MSGTKTSRADLKNRFKKGMYPTEGDFANVFESYVHKDDDISMSKVVLTDGDGNTTTLNNVIGNKADKTDLTEITNRLTTAENDIDTAEDNIAGHETRIADLETSKTDYEVFKERVRAFLEDADASEETINRWHEIESFLQGITDTQTLAGLLNDLKQEILQSIPQSQQGNYLQLIDDLDAYTDAPNGAIVKYTGPTTDSYTHGFDYERVVGEAEQIVVPAGTKTYQPLTNDSEDWNSIVNSVSAPFYIIGTVPVNYGSGTYWLPDAVVGDCVWSQNQFYPITSISDGSVSFDKNGSITTVSVNSTDQFTDLCNADGIHWYTPKTPSSVIVGNNSTLTVVNLRDQEAFSGWGHWSATDSEVVLSSTSSWQLIPSMPVIQ